MTTSFLEKMFNDDQDLPTFVLSCARGMALLHEWNEIWPLPTELPENPYYASALEEAKARLYDMHVKRRDDEDALGRALRDEKIASLREGIATEEGRERKIEAMKAAVAGWQDPTEEAGLKRFILQQLGVFSSSAEYFHERIRRLEAQTTSKVVADEITDAEEILTYAEEGLRKYRERLKDAREWLAQVRASLEAAP